MSRVLEVLHALAVWWQEGLAKIGAQVLQAYDWPAAPIDTEADAEADRAAWEEERARLALSPWWM